MIVAAVIALNAILNRTDPAIVREHWEGNDDILDVIQRVLSRAEVLLGGDHAAIRRWRLKQALGRTWQRRPDLLEAMELDDEQQELLAEFVRERE